MKLYHFIPMLVTSRPRPGSRSPIHARTFIACQEYKLPTKNNFTSLMKSRNVFTLPDVMLTSHRPQACWNVIIEHPFSRCIVCSQTLSPRVEGMATRVAIVDHAYFSSPSECHQYCRPLPYILCCNLIILIPMLVFF